MKNKQLLKLLLSVVFLYISLAGFTQTPYISFLSGGWQNYCSDAVPGGGYTFALTLNNGRCGEWDSWSWVGITGDGCDGNNPKTVYVSYPTTTTQYECVVNMTYHYYFEITVNPAPGSFNVTGDNCCASTDTVKLSGSQSGVTYHLYKNGSDAGDDRSGNGNPINWTGKNAGTYTVKAVNNSTACDTWMNGDCVINTSCCKEIKSETEDNETLIPELKAYPNPNNGSFIIENVGGGEYVLLNEVGQEVQQITFTTTNKSFEINGLKPGIYFIKNKDGRTTTVNKITVVK